MKTSVLRRLGLAAMAVVAVGTLGCPSAGGGGKAYVNRVDPPEGAAAGGLTVIVVGSNFEGGPASVYFDGKKATDVVVLDDTRIQCVTPAMEVGVVDVEVRSSGNVGKKEFGFEFLSGAETKEPPNENGGNDTFAAYERIPIEYDFQGYIGTQGDEDIFHIHPPDGGKVYISLSWDDSFNAGGGAGIAAMQIDFFQGPDPTPDPDAYFGGSIIGTHDGSGPPPRIEDWMRPSFVVDGAHGPYLRVKAFGDANHAGYDPMRPYILRVEYEPDPTVEPAPQSDSFRNATQIDPVTAPVDLTVNAAYDDDFDWYHFAVPSDGWARVVVDASGLGTIDTAGELSIGAKLFWVDPSDPDGNHVYSVPGAEADVIDAPGPVARVFEATSLEAQQVYKLRLTNSQDAAMSPYDYSVSVEYGAGGIEDGEPGTLDPAETKQTANDLGSLEGMASLGATGYVFHDGDDDWFSFVAPDANCASVVISWDHTDVSSGANGIGFYDPATNPLGGEFRLLVFDQAWYDAGLLPTVVETVGGAGFDTSVATDTKSVDIATTGGETYYIYLDGVRGWSTSESYTLTITNNC